MRISIHLGYRFLFLLALAGAAPSVRAAVTFTTTPAVVSNMYPGFISLQIGGLTNTETVVVQKFIDRNTNGVIDGADVMVQQFLLTDGSNSIVGGVTNLNVPGDANTATGAITATLSFRNGDFMQNLAAHYLYKLSSPGGHFTPLTNSLVVTNFLFGQSFTGNVVSNSTSLTLSNATVVAFPPPRSGHGGPGQPVAGTIANNAGQYSLSLPPGSYTLLAFETNFVASFQTAPVVTLSSGVNLATNLTLIPATTTISGSVVDAANPALGLPGVFLALSSTNNLITAAFTDTNGNFTARVTSSQWNLGADDAGLIIHGYVGYQNGVQAVAPATGVTVSFPRANVLFYGTVTNSQGIPQVYLDVNASDNVSNLYSMDGYTDMNGNYVVGAVATGANDPWEESFSSESQSLLTNDIISQPPFDLNNGTNLTAGLAILQNFIVLPATNFITGSVKDSGNNPVTNVQVYASATLGGQDFQPFVNTDVNGNYSLQVANGMWYVNVYCGGGQNSLPTNYLCPNTAIVTIANNNVSTNFVVQLCTGVAISTSATLPVGEVGVPYSQFLSASSCAPAFTWVNLSGSAALPAGVTFTSNGQLSGTPTANGVFMFTAQVTDGNNATASRSFTLTVNTGVHVTTTSLPNGTNGLPYAQQLQASGGQIFGGASPYSWSLSPGSFSLPANLNLATNGVISGTAATSGTFGFSVRVTDLVGSYADQALGLTLIATNTLPPPSTAITTAGSQLLVYYPQSGSNFVLQTATNLNGPWVPATNGVPVISVLFTNNSPVQFYRLH